MIQTPQSSLGSFPGSEASSSQCLARPNNPERLHDPFPCLSTFLKPLNKKIAFGLFGGGSWSSPCSPWSSVSWQRGHAAGRSSLGLTAGEGQAVGT